MRKVYSVPILSLLAWGLASCRSLSPSKLNESVPSTAADRPLDVNDVSILMPLPDSFEQVSKLLPIHFANEQGHTPMTPSLFAEIIGRHKTKIIVEGVERPLQSESQFFNPEAPDEARFDQIDSWKIVAMRYDPCAPSAAHNLRQKGPLELPKSFNMQVCLPQLRLTAQPIVRTQDSFTVGDYAIHMLFNLTEGETRSLYQDLVAFKSSCGDVTTSVPLGQHPCLLIEKAQGQFGGEKLQKIFSLVKKYAHTYAGTAMMATKMGTDPWSFMNGFIVDGHFQHQPIDAVAETDPARIKRNKKGQILEPFLNGYFQMLSFHNVGLLVDEDGKAKENILVSPPGKRNKLNAVLDKELTIRVEQPVDLDHALHNAIENPRLNDFFSTDCVTCHSSSDVYAHRTRLRKEEWAMFLDEGESMFHFYTRADPFDPQNAPYQLRLKEANVFELDAPYADIIDFASLTRSASDDPYGLIHFGYFEKGPAISPRVSHESALVAKLANAFFKGSDPSELCPLKPLRACMLSSGFFFKAKLGLGLLADCMDRLCPQRAADLSPILGPVAPRSYRLKEDYALRRSPNDNPPIGTLAKGTIVSGWLVDNRRRLEMNRSAQAVRPQGKPGIYYYGDLSFDPKIFEELPRP